ASTLARHLGVEVTGATRQVWTYLDGRQVVASPDPRDGSRPTEPPDGTWVTYTPDGRATTHPSSDPRAGGTGPNPIAQAGGGGRAGEVLYRGGDGRLHAAGDPLGTHRTEDGHLHREPRTGRLHPEADAPGTYRTERGFRLMSADTRTPVPDPLRERSQPVRQHAVEGPIEPYQPRQSPDPVDQAARRLGVTRQALADLRRNGLRPLMDEFGVDRRALSRANLADTLRDLRARADDPAALDRINRLEALATEQARLEADVRRRRHAVTMTAARHVLRD